MPQFSNVSCACEQGGRGRRGRALQPPGGGGERDAAQQRHLLRRAGGRPRLRGLAGRFRPGRAAARDRGHHRRQRVHGGAAGAHRAAHRAVRRLLDALLLPVRAAPALSSAPVPAPLCARTTALRAWPLLQGQARATSTSARRAGARAAPPLRARALQGCVPGLATEGAALPPSSSAA
jgi:hypothetical protein